MGTHQDFTEHTNAALAKLAPIQGPAVDSDLCTCGHDRGSHWDGVINCGDCDCHTFKAAR